MTRDLSAQIAESAGVMAKQGEDPGTMLRWLVYIFAGELSRRDRLRLAWSALRR